jgi:hypothetical protein
MEYVSGTISINKNGEIYNRFGMHITINLIAMKMGDNNILCGGYMGSIP